MRLLYFASVDFYSKPNPSFHLMTTMISDLLDAGFDINFVGCALQGLEKHIPDEFKDNPKFKFDLVNIPVTAKSNFSKRFLDGIKYAASAKKYLKKYIGDSDVIYVQSSPTVVFNLMTLKRLVNKNQKIIYNVQDMFPGSSISSGVMPQKLLQKFFYAFQRNAYNVADVIVGISDDMKTKLIEQSVRPEKIRVILNWFDDHTVHNVPWDENSFVKDFDMKKQTFYVQYAGTMGYVFDYKMILDVAESLREYDDIVFQMIGEGSQKQAFVDESIQRNLKNIVFLPLQSQEKVSEVYSSCSVCLIPLKKGVIGNSVPSKAGLLMACKKPIISSVDADSEYAKMINKNSLGIAVDNDNPNGVKEAILTMYNDRIAAEQMGENGYKYGHDLYSRSNNMKKYICLFNEQ